MTPATHRRPVSISRLAWSRSMSRNVRVDVGARAIAAASSSARACRVGRAFVTVAMPFKKEGKAPGGGKPAFSGGRGAYLGSRGGPGRPLASSFVRGGCGR